MSAYSDAAAHVNGNGYSDGSHAGYKSADVDMAGPSTSSLRYPNINGYRLGEEIGGGGFSKVFRAIDDKHSRVAACKVVNLFISPSLGQGTPNIAELKKEVQVHKALEHEYILRFLHAETYQREREAEGWVPGLYMLLELAIGGDLFDKIVPDVGVPEDLAKFYFAQLCHGIAFIHDKGIAHRDLKPENLLLAANGNLKISDFGLCAVFRHKGKERLLSGRCGSLPYVAPELGDPNKASYAAEPVDIWGLGVVLYTLLVGNTPWDEPSDNSPEFRAFQTGELLQYDPWTRIRGQARSILLAMLEIDPRRRITMHQISAHPWMMTPSQLNREQMADALTQGLRTTGMMAIVDPVKKTSEGQTYAQLRSQRMMTESQVQSQFSKLESQFMRGTGNITQAGDFITITTRFYLSLSPSHAIQLLHPYLTNLLLSSGGTVHVAHQQTDRAVIQVSKAAGQKSVMGTFEIRGSDAMGDEAGTVVVMRRAKGSSLHWRAFWWSVVRDQAIEPYVVKGE